MCKNLCRAIIIAIGFCLPVCIMAQWTKTSGPPGTNVNYFYNSGNILFAGTSSKGVYRSFDDGVTWQAANTGISNSSVFALISDAAFLYAGTNSGVFRSDDNGETWQAANTGI